MRAPTLELTHPEATRARLMALAKDIPGAWIGIKIAALLLTLEGQRPGWIAEVLGLTRMSLTRWIHGVNATGLEALRPKPRPGRPPRLTPQVRQALATQLEQSPQAFGLPRVQWDGPTLVVHLKRQFGIALKVRQAQLWMHQLGYRLKRASHAYLQARTVEARRFRQKVKKTYRAGPARDPRLPR
ncbi:MAG: helix-turn-helix domain-containing protein [Deltaproteobacteria bacterium]|nr:helix-turn-helix domain-containing protein [Deltaproteobacteria bacterium]